MEDPIVIIDRGGEIEAIVFFFPRTAKYLKLDEREEEMAGVTARYEQRREGGIQVV